MKLLAILGVTITTLLVAPRPTLLHGAPSHSGPPMQQQGEDENIASDISAIGSRYRNMMTKVNSRNIVNTMSNYSINFYNQGLDYYDGACLFAMAFVTPGYTLRLTNLRVTYTAVQLPYGYMEGIIRVKETQNGIVVTDSDFGVAMYFVKEGSTWRLYGDQTSVASSMPGDGIKTMKALSSPRRN